MKSSLGVHLLYSVMGLTMGLLLSAIGFADYDELFKMFVFENMRMIYIFGSAVIISGLVFSVLHFTQIVPFERKPFHTGTIPGSILFGYGWAICGACPSVVFIQLGQGKLAAVMTLIGIYLGVRSYRAMHSRYFGWDTGACGI